MEIWNININSVCAMMTAWSNSWQIFSSSLAANVAQLAAWTCLASGWQQAAVGSKQLAAKWLLTVRCKILKEQYFLCRN
jgi:hypothetical protein